MTELLLGADVGGSSTRVAVATVTGQVLAQARGGPGNPNVVGLEGSAAEISSTAERALDRLAGDVVSAVVGLAGGSRVATATDFARAALPPRVRVPAGVVSDLAVTFSSATPAWAGCTLIAGTGAVAARVVGEQLQDRRDGWGWLLGDEGSGFWLGRAAVQETLQALDAGDPLGPLHRDVLTEAGATDQPSLLNACYERPPTWLARLAPLVSRWAATDPVAAAVADRAADLLAATLVALAPAADEPVVLGGSVLATPGPVRDRVAARLGPGLTLLQAESGLVGATWIAARRLGRDSPDLHARLSASLSAAPQR